MEQYIEKMEHKSMTIGQDGKNSSFGNTVAYGGGGGGSYTESGDGSGNRGGSAGGSATPHTGRVYPLGYSETTPGNIKHWYEDKNLSEIYLQGTFGNSKGGGGAGGSPDIYGGVGRFNEDSIDYKDYFKITNEDIGEHIDSKVYFGGGGGNGENKVSKGGLGGGGGNAVIDGSSTWNNIDGKPNTGGGGSGAVSIDSNGHIIGGKGGSGIIIIRENIPPPKKRETVISYSLLIQSENTNKLYEYRITKYLYNLANQDSTGQTSYTFTLTETSLCDILIVGGGGGGGTSYNDNIPAIPSISGGEAGGVIFLKDQVILAGDYTVKVGKGGDGAIYRSYQGQNNDDGQDIDGKDSSFGETIAYGGKRGSSYTSTSGLSEKNDIDFKEYFDIIDTNIGEHTTDSKVYFGGEGGSSSNKISFGGLGGGGGNNAVSGSTWNNIDGKPNTGGGGSGAVSVDTNGDITTIRGGNGGSGIVIIRTDKLPEPEPEPELEPEPDPKQNLNLKESIIPTGNNIIETAFIQLNGNDRFTKRNGEYFSLVQPYQHHTNIPLNAGINLYSFALKPEEYQPSGTLNISKVNTTELIVKPKKQGTLRLWGVNYNVLRVLGGIGGIVYSN